MIFIIFIPKTNTNRSPDMQNGQELTDLNKRWRLTERKLDAIKWSVNWNKGKYVKLIQKGKQQWCVSKEVDYFQSALSKNWCKYKKKKKYTWSPRKITKRQDRKLKAICPENWKRNKWIETGVNVYDMTKNIDVCVDLVSMFYGIFNVKAILVEDR